jgi:hypothetical protein
MAGEDVPRAAGAGLDGLGDVTLAKTVAVADVHDGITQSMRLIMVLYRAVKAIASRSHAWAVDVIASAAHGGAWLANPTFPTGRRAACI